MNMGVHDCTVTRKSNINHSVLLLFNIELNIPVSDMLSLKLHCSILAYNNTGAIYSN